MNGLEKMFLSEIAHRKMVVRNAERMVANEEKNAKSILERKEKVANGERVCRASVLRIYSSGIGIWNSGFSNEMFK